MSLGAIGAAGGGPAADRRRGPRTSKRLRRLRRRRVDRRSGDRPHAGRPASRTTRSATATGRSASAWTGTRSSTGDRSPRRSRRSRSCNSSIAASCRSTTRVTRLHARTPPRARSLRVDGLDHRPDAALALRRGFQDPTWPWTAGEAVGAVRADDVEAARRDDAVPGARLQAGHTLQLLEPRLHLPRADHRAAHRRSVGGVRPEEHLRAARDHAQLLQRRRRTISPRTGRTTTT